jgi:hypothetical protein
MGSSTNQNTSRPTTATTWFRTSAPTPTPSAPSSMAIRALRPSWAASSPASGSGRSRTERIAVPTIVTPIEIATDSSAPAAAKASVLAARKRSRSGAARRELVMVRWRHSPPMPITARTTRKRLLVSDVNTSTSTDSSVGSVSSATSPAMTSDVPMAAPASPANVRVVRSLISSARSSAFMRPPRSARGRRPPGSARPRRAPRGRCRARRRPRRRRQGEEPRTSRAPAAGYLRPMRRRSRSATIGVCAVP